jgi:molybdopterin-guanine dinucleotide biosynthesis protein A
LTDSPAGIVLAGGRSRRFGRDKASASFLGRPLLGVVLESLGAVCPRLFVVCAAGQHLPPVVSGPPYTVVRDTDEGQGPLAGLIAGLARAGPGLVIAVSTDAPLLQPSLLADLAGLAPDYDVALPVVAGFPQPLVATYRQEMCLPALRASFDAGNRSVVDALDGLHVRIVDENDLRRVDPDLRSFRNVNRPEDLVALEHLARED